MNWRAELEELRLREQLAHEMGGADKVKRQHDGGRLTVRERIDGLVDAGSFHETGAIAGSATYDENNELESFTASNCVFGRARIDGRPVVVVGDDFTVRGGSADAAIHEKPLMAERMAAEFRLPIIRIIEGSGGGGSVKTIETKGRANLPGGVGQSMLVPLHQRQHGRGAGRRARPRVGRRARRRAARRQPLFGNDQDPPPCSSPDRRWWPASARTSASRNWAAGRSRPAAAPSIMPSTAKKRPSPARGASSPICRTRCMSCRRSSTATTIRIAAMKVSWTAIPKDRRKVYKVRPIIEALVDRGSFFEMGAHVRPPHRYRTGTIGRPRLSP